MPDSLPRLLEAIRACSLCAADLPLGPRPVVQAGSTARVLIAGQAPGTRVHASGVPWQDASGNRLRAWLGLTPDVFYDASRVALVPMGFCYPGRAGGGDAPPRPECAPAWRDPLLALLPEVQVTIVIGVYAQAWHLRGRGRGSVSDTVEAWAAYAPQHFPLPHPSPRNEGWLRERPWFAAQVVPALQRRVHEVLAR